MYSNDVMQFLTVQETAQILRVTPLTVRRFIAAGRISAVKAGKGVRVRKESVEEFIRPVEPKDQKAETGLPKGRPLTFEDPLWELVGSANDAEPTDASKKYEYLAEPLAPTRP